MTEAAANGVSTSGDLPQPLDAARVRAAVATLRARLAGRVIAPGDDRYDAARVVFRGEIDKHPAVIVRPANAADVAIAIEIARDAGAELAVRSGGHSAAGHGTSEGGIVVDLRDMNALEIDSARRTAWAETGLSAAEVTRGAWQHRLAIGFGDTGSVGIGGITLGGGIGYLARKHGLTIDNLLAADVVIADGDVVRADANHHPELFWAIRGGGGNFGVATRFHYELAPLPGFVGGMLVLPATPEVIAGFIEAADEAPDELWAIANVMGAPPMPGVPPELVGQLVVFALMAYAGDATAGEQAMSPFHKLAMPIIDSVKPMPYPEIYSPDDESYRPKALDRTMFLDSVDIASARTMLEHLAASDAPLRAVQLRVLGGAMARVPAEATAFAHRQRRILAVCVNFFAGEEDYPRRAAWLESITAALDQGVPGAYVNFLGDEGEARVHDAYPGTTWDRLVEVKQRYDPTNVFRINQNIPPG